MNAGNLLEYNSFRSIETYTIASVKENKQPFLAMYVNAHPAFALHNRKWYHRFESAMVILFVAAINEFNQTLKEDPSVNRLEVLWHWAGSHGISPLSSLFLNHHVYHSYSNTKNDTLFFFSKCHAASESL